MSWIIYKPASELVRLDVSYWNKDQGWLGKKDATRFTSDERNYIDSNHVMPEGGEWIVSGDDNVPAVIINADEFGKLEELRLLTGIHNTLKDILDIMEIKK